MIVTGILAGASRRLWTPADLGTPPSLWFNDDSAITTVSGFVSQWNDISGNGYHHDQATSARRPEPLAAELNGRRVIRFDGSDDLLLSLNTGALDLYRNQANLAEVVVYKKRATDGGAGKILLYCPNNAGASRCSLAVSGTAGGEADRTRFIARSTDAGGAAVLTQGTSLGAAWQIVVCRSELANTDGYLHINGTLDQTSTSFTAGSATSDTRPVPGIGMGASFNTNPGNPPNTGSPADCDMAERLLIRAALTSADVARIEGYLAHRWGLTASLPSDHPFRNSPPYV